MNGEQPQNFDYDLPPVGSVNLPPSYDVSFYDKVIDNNELIDELMHTLRAEIVDNVKNEIKQVGKPIVSAETVSWMIGRLLPYTSKIFTLSYWPNEKIARRIIYEFEVEVSLDLMFPKKCGVGRKNRDYVKWIIVHCFEASIYKALNGETLRKLLEQHSVQETTIKRDREQQNWMKNQMDRFKI